MLLINLAWNELFTHTGMNQKVVTDREWGPYNRNIFTYFQIRATMIECNKCNEIHYNVIIS